MENSLLDFEAVKEEVEIFVDEMLVKYHSEPCKSFEDVPQVPDTPLVREARLSYTIGSWQSDYRRLAIKTKDAIEAITVIKADWENKAVYHDDSVTTVHQIGPAEEEEEYAIGVVAGLKIALEVLTSKIK
jgi:hypothetical protein